LRVLSGRDVCRILAAHGFEEVRRRGSHIVMQQRTGTSTRTVPVPDHSELTSLALRGALSAAATRPPAASVSAWSRCTPPMASVSAVSRRRPCFWSYRDSSPCHGLTIRAPKAQPGHAPRGGRLHHYHWIRALDNGGPEYLSSRIGAVAPGVRRPLLWAVDTCRSSHAGLVRGE